MLRRSKGIRFLLAFKYCFVILFFYGVLSCCSTALAVTSESQAKLVANNFLKFLGSSKNILSMQSVQSNLIDSSKPLIVSGWLMDLSNGGYILISSSKTFYPVKAYSLKSDYTTLPLPYRKFIEKEMELYARIENDSSPGKRTNQSLSKTNLAEHAWDFLIHWQNAGRMVQSYTPDTHLLTTAWNQGYPYNKFLPEINGQQVLAGCVNVALAQVMKYHEYPNSGAGSTAYLWNNEQLKTILQHPYYWNNMPNFLGMAAPSYQQDEVAILIRDLAIINRTSFGLNASSAHVHQDAFERFSGYSNLLSSMDNSNSDDFFSTMKNQIDNELPVLLSFPGHMVVVDGYKSDPTGRKFHVNMGWGGSDDNYYYLDRTVHTSFYSFEPDLNILYNIKPCSGPDCIYPPHPVTDIPPQLNTRFKDMIINASVTTPHLIRIDARDENGDKITFSTSLSNSDTITTDITNSILKIQPLPGSDKKAVTIQITIQAGGKTIKNHFLVMVNDQAVTFGKNQNIMGTFKNQNDAYAHLAILDGNCTIKGDTGYSNQAFFISIRDSKNNLVVPYTDGSDNPSFPAIQHNFPFGLYTIYASLSSGSTHYNYTEGDHDDYIIQVNSPEVSSDVQKIARLININLAQINLFAPGDINNDGQVNLGDKILALKIITGLDDTIISDSTDDANGDGRIGLEESLFWK